MAHINQMIAQYQKYQNPFWYLRYHTQYQKYHTPLKVILILGTNRIDGATTEQRIDRGRTATPEQRRTATHSRHGRRQAYQRNPEPTDATQSATEGLHAIAAGTPLAGPSGGFLSKTTRGDTQPKY